MKNISILIAEDEKKIRGMMIKYLINEGYETFEASNGEEALDIVENHPIDLVVLDVMMPVMDGWSCLREIRSINESLPIIMLTARGEENDKIFGFELGVDDYMTKPFSIKELLVRIKALLKRSGKKTVEEVLALGNLIIQTNTHSIFIDDKRVDVTATEYDLLLYFANNLEIALTREQIINRVWGYDYFGDIRTVDTHIKRLRKKIALSTFSIETVRGVGYQGRT